MDVNRICPGCMRMRPEGATVCGNCGFDTATYKPEAYYVLPLDTILHGRYLVGRYLGAGGFGVTYIGYDLTLQTPVAIKEFFMRSNMYRDSTVTTTVTMSLTSKDDQHVVEANYRKFREEALTLARLNQLPGIVHVYDCFEENQTMYIVMDYLAGPTLKTYVKNKGSKMTWDETVNLLTPVIRSLGMLHRENVLHRDIAPDNMMFGKDGRLCLIDFGGAKESYVEKGDQRSSVALMKPGYSPVEQMTVSGKQGPWTDEYALAATMYYCLCGKAPADSLARMTGENYIPVNKLNSSVKAPQAAVLEKALAIRPEERYPNMEAFLDALLNVTAGDMSRTVSEVAGKTTAPAKRTNKALLVIPAVILAAVVAIGGISASKLLRSSTENTESSDTLDLTSDQLVDRGYKYETGDGVAQDYEKAVEYYQKAADMGNKIGQHNLGYMYQYGYGVEQNYKKAVEYYQLSADQNYAKAQCNLGYMYEFGYGVDQDYEKAAELYQLAADGGNDIAQTNLGYMYDAGYGVDQDYEEAARYYLLAADQGFARAQYNLGYLYEYGYGVDQDYEKAAEYFQEAVDQNYASAQLELGYFYENGYGVEQDYQKAYEYYKLAADQGNEIAQYNLGLCYQYGRYVNIDLEKAKQYYQMALDNGYEKAQAKLNEISQ